MPFKNWSSQDLVIAWAVEVSLPQLGASLLAWAETKSAITALRREARKTLLKPLHNLPEEMLSRIADKLDDMTFRENMEAWIKMCACLTGECNLRSHASQEEIDEVARHFTPGMEAEFEDALKEKFGEVWLSRHEKLRSELPGDLTDNVESNFKRSAWRFFRKFGIFPYCIASKLYNEWGRIDKVHCKAYLTLPIETVTIELDCGFGCAGFFYDSMLDPSVFQGLSDKGRDKLQIAAKMLKIHPYDPEEDESVYADEPLGPNFADPQASEESRSSERDSEKEREKRNEGENNKPQSGTHSAGNKMTKPSTGPIRLKLSFPGAKKPVLEFKPRLRILGCTELYAYDSGRATDPSKYYYE